MIIKAHEEEIRKIEKAKLEKILLANFKLMEERKRKENRLAAIQHEQEQKRFAMEEFIQENPEIHQEFEAWYAIKKLSGEKDEGTMD